jgi:hypothetical protein
MFHRPGYCVLVLHNIMMIVARASHAAIVRQNTTIRWRLQLTSSVCSLSSSVPSSRRVPSLGFSGAGFLGCYHLGVASCFLKHGLLLPRGEVPTVVDHDQQRSNYPVLLGASAGAITAAAVSAGVHPEDGMNVVLDLRRSVVKATPATTTEAGGGSSLWSALPLDVFRPGFSLIDQVAQIMMPYFHEALNGGDEELFQRRISNGRGLRIALTDRAAFVKNPHHDFARRAVDPPTTDDDDAPNTAEHNMKQQRQSSSVDPIMSHMPNAYCYIDSYRSISDVAHACILSSFIPGVTGPLKGVDDLSNTAVHEASAAINELVKLGAVKHGPSGRVWSPPVRTNNTKSTDNSARATVDEHFWDGGLSCIWPTLDDDTVIVCPFRANYHPNPAVHPAQPLPQPHPSEHEHGNMNPFEMLASMLPKSFPFHGKSVDIGLDNAETSLRMAISSDESILEERFQCGYSDATRFLKEHDLLAVYSNTK